MGEDSGYFGLPGRVGETHRDEQGHLHRVDGPAIIYEDGYREWYIHGIDITFEVVDWMSENNISWPWDKETQMLFKLTWTYDHEPIPADPIMFPWYPPAGMRRGTIK